MGNEIKNCYGRKYCKLPECRACKYRNYCKDAKDPFPLIADYLRFVPLEPQSPGELPAWREEELLNPSHNRLTEEDENKPCFSRADLLEAVAWTITLDDRLLELLAIKLEKPTASLAELGRAKSITRQVVHEYLKIQIKRRPELARFFTWRKQRKRRTANAREVVK